MWLGYSHSTASKVLFLLYSARQVLEHLVKSAKGSERGQWLCDGEVEQLSELSVNRTLEIVNNPGYSGAKANAYKRDSADQPMAFGDRTLSHIKFCVLTSLTTDSYTNRCNEV